MQNPALLDMVRKDDPAALQLVAENRRAYYLVKRVIDFCLAFILLVLFSPLMLVIALAIKFYSPGPVFFIQERVGARRYSRGGAWYWRREDFPCYKFRTMHVNADSAIHEAYIRALIENDEQKIQELQGDQSAVRKLSRDARITRPGKLLRKLSLDELPQLFNVLRGEMSMVGPRPAIPYEVAMYKPWYLRRLEAQPGLAGLQQVKLRCFSEFDEQMQLDVEYVENQSLWLDIKIIFMTPFVVLSTKGAK